MRIQLTVWLVSLVFFIGGVFSSMTINAEPMINDDETITIWSTNRTFEEDYVIGSDETVVINPGIILQFNQSVRFIVNGTLLVEGREDRRVIFTYNKTSESDMYFEYWMGIVFNRGSKGMIRNSIIEYAFFGIEIRSSSPYIVGNVIRFNWQGSGINLDGALNPIISDNKIIDNNFGIFSDRRSTAIIANCNISNNGVGIETNSFLLISNVTFFDNLILTINFWNDSSPIIIDCIISGTEGTHFWLHRNTHPKVYNTIFDEDNVTIDDEATLTVDGKIFREEKDDGKDRGSLFGTNTYGIIISIFIILILVILVIITIMKCRKQALSKNPVMNMRSQSVRRFENGQITGKFVSARKHDNKK